jgi:hypothetical protein
VRGVARKRYKTLNMSPNRRLSGKDYVGCIVQIITIIAGIFAIIQGIAWLLGEFK